MPFGEKMSWEKGNLKRLLRRPERLARRAKTPDKREMEKQGVFMNKSGYIISSQSPKTLPSVSLTRA